MVLGMESNTNNGNEMKTLSPSESIDTITTTARENGAVRIQRNGTRVLITPHGPRGFQVFFPLFGTTDLASKEALGAHLAGFRW